MADYKGVTQTVQKWQRCYRIVAERPRAGTMRMEFLEEAVRATDGKEDEAVVVSGCSLDFKPAEVIELRNPNTGNLLNKTMTQAELYVLLYSAYRHAADLRDAAQGATP